jgi:O-acetyl-ADP-ribose deacetylase (regulator of RNase III)
MPVNGRKPGASMHRIDLGHGKVLEFVEGDLTREKADAIVNAANSSLMGGGGVDGAIHRAGGSEILKECRAWVEKNGRLPTGKAMHTTAGAMPARFVIHTVGPIWHEGRHGEPELLASCYRESIRCAEELKLNSVAFPSISTGAYGYPIEQAAEVAVHAAADALKTTTFVHTVRFVLFGSRDYRVYKQAAANLAGAAKAN